MAERKTEEQPSIEDLTQESDRLEKERSTLVSLYSEAHQKITSLKNQLNIQINACQRLKEDLYLSAKQELFKEKMKLKQKADEKKNKKSNNVFLSTIYAVLSVLCIFTPPALYLIFKFTVPWYNLILFGIVAIGIIGFCLSLYSVLAIAVPDRDKAKAEATQQTQAYNEAKNELIQACEQYNRNQKVKEMNDTKKLLRETQVTLANKQQAATDFAKNFIEPLEKQIKAQQLSRQCKEIEGITQQSKPNSETEQKMEEKEENEPLLDKDKQNQDNDNLDPNMPQIISPQLPDNNQRDVPPNFIIEDNENNSGNDDDREEEYKTNNQSASDEESEYKGLQDAFDNTNPPAQYTEENLSTFGQKWTQMMSYMQRQQPWPNDALDTNSFSDSNPSNNFDENQENNREYTEYYNDGSYSANNNGDGTINPRRYMSAFHQQNNNRNNE